MNSAGGNRSLQRGVEILRAFRQGIDVLEMERSQSEPGFRARRSAGSRARWSKPACWTMFAANAPTGWPQR